MPSDGVPRTGRLVSRRAQEAVFVRALCAAIEAARPLLEARGLEGRCMRLIAEFLLGDE